MLAFEAKKAEIMLLSTTQMDLETLQRRNSSISSYVNIYKLAWELTVDSLTHIKALLANLSNWFPNWKLFWEGDSLTDI